VSVLKTELAHHLFHLVLQAKLEFFQTMLLDFLFSGEHVFTFQLLHQAIVLMVLRHEVAKLLVRLHQVRFDFVLSVPIHSGHVSSSGVAAPGRGELGQRPGG